MHFAQYDGQVYPQHWADINNAFCWLFLMVILTFLYKCSLNGTNVALGKRLRVYTLPFIVKVLTFAP